MSTTRFGRERRAKRRNGRRKRKKSAKKSGRERIFRATLRPLWKLSEYKPHTGGFGRSRATRIKCKKGRKVSKTIEIAWKGLNLWKIQKSTIYRDKEVIRRRELRNGAIRLAFCYFTLVYTYTHRIGENAISRFRRRKIRKRVRKNAEKYPRY